MFLRTGHKRATKLATVSSKMSKWSNVAFNAPCRETGPPRGAKSSDTAAAAETGTVVAAAEGGWEGVQINPKTVKTTRVSQSSTPKKIE